MLEKFRILNLESKGGLLVLIQTDWHLRKNIEKVAQPLNTSYNCVFCKSAQDSQCFLIVCQSWKKLFRTCMFPIEIIVIFRCHQPTVIVIVIIFFIVMVILLVIVICFCYILDPPTMASCLEMLCVTSSPLLKQTSLLKLNK